jgi:acyl-CoA reductase-like NAD-dependent aldehyde dehydrogenase
MRQMALIVTNPVTEETIAELDAAGVEETDAAVARAKQAFEEWRAVAPTDRARLLRRLATLVEEHAEELAPVANDTPYGLSGSIWTENGARALRVARALESDVLSINSNSSVRPSTPFGGFKHSGFDRELGMHALDGYSEIKNVYLATGGG